MKNGKIFYDVGPLLYTPAYNRNIIKKIQNEEFGKHFSLSFCLEDTVNDDFLEEAENILKSNLTILYKLKKTNNFYLPNIFIRVRNASQIIRLSTELQDSISLIKGFIIPKFCPSNCDQYISSIKKVNEITKHKLYFQPTLESDFLIDLQHRTSNLTILHSKLNEVEDLVLNIRVGGNDLCNLFGFRRNQTETIYKLLPIANIFSDIITIFGNDYVISGPVWEYYNGTDWEKYFQKEIIEDRLCGFIGKTVIHPAQINIVNEAYKVSKTDYNDAKAILNWDKSSISFVSGNSSTNRMNEYKTHYNWAEKILYLAEIYGIK